MPVSPKILRAKNVTRSDLAEAVYNQLGLSRTESAELVEMTLQEIAAALQRGEPVKLTGFGVFEVRSKRERIGRNPKTGVEAIIPARRVLTFKPSGILRVRLTNDRQWRIARRAQGVTLCLQGVGCELRIGHA